MHNLSRIYNAEVLQHGDKEAQRGLHLFVHVWADTLTEPPCVWREREREREAGNSALMLGARLPKGDKQPQGDIISFETKSPLFMSKTSAVYDVVSDLWTDRILTGLSEPSISCHVNVTLTRSIVFSDNVHVLLPV